MKKNINKLQDKYDKEIKILNTKIEAKENVIAELRSVSRSSMPMSPSDRNFDKELSKVSDKIRQEYIMAIETLQMNLQSLKIKYQSEVSSRKNDLLQFKEASRALKRQISILQEEKSINVSGDFSQCKSQLLEAKSQIIKVSEENECLHSVLASTKAAWAQSEMDKEDIRHKYSKKKEEVGLYSERIAELELQVVRSKQDLIDAMNSLWELQKGEDTFESIEF